MRAKKPRVLEAFPLDGLPVKTPMVLALTRTKGDARIEDRTYKCPKCGHSESWIASQNVPKAKGGQSTHH